MDNCPTCLREFRGLQDYPYLYIVRFERGEIPEAIPHWWNELRHDEMPPEEVLRMFQETGKPSVVHNGFVFQRDGPYKDPGETQEHFYYRKTKDLAPKVRGVVESPQVQRYLESLESYVGKEVQTRDVLPSWEKDSRFGVFSVPNSRGYSVYSVSFEEGDRKNDYRNSNLNLMGEGPNMGSAGGPTLSVWMTLGTITYEGKVRVTQAV